MLVTNASGEQEQFRVSKLEASLRGAGADEKTIKSVIAHVESDLRDGVTTNEIYNHAFDLLRRNEPHPVAARYSLKRAMMELGPTGFPFEKFLAEIFRAKGFNAETNVVLEGACVKHEIDFVADREDTLIVGEAKFHNRPGVKTDLKVILYLDSRFRDIQNSQFGGRCKDEQMCRSWVITNTKFTKNARTYAHCSGTMTLVGWNYPKEHNLQQMIEETGLHPVTCLTTLSKAEKKALFDRGKVLCRSIKRNESLLREIGVVGTKAVGVLEEADALCVARSG